MFTVIKTIVGGGGGLSKLIKPIGLAAHLSTGAYVAKQRIQDNVHV